jgi:phage tail sheath gpL-like
MSSPNISFTSIPSSIRKPGRYTEYNADLAVRGLPAPDNKVVIIGQPTSSGIATLYQPTRIFSAADANLYAGSGSNLALTAAAAFTANPNLELSICTTQDGTTAATGSIAISGDSSSVGSIDLWIANNYFNVGVANGDTSTVIATAMLAAINEKTTTLPVTAARTAGTINLTARNLGSQGNQIAVAYKKNTVDAVTVTAVQPTGGGADPSIASALTACLPGKYNIYVVSNNDAVNLGLLKTHLNTISGPTEGRPAIGVYGYNGVQATIETLAGTTLNSNRLSVGYHKSTRTTQRGHSLDYEIAGAYAAVIASEEDPARPLNTLPLVGIAPAAIEDRFSRTQVESLLDNGVTPLEVSNGEQVMITRSVTNYITNSTGTVDPAYLDITTIRTLDYLRLAWETRMALRFPRAKLSSRTPNMVRAQTLDVLRQLEALEIIDRVEENKNGIIVEFDSVDANRLNVLIPADVVNGLHIIASQIVLYL